MLLTNYSKSCTHVAIMNKGQVVCSGTLEEVSNGMSLEDRFIESVGAGTEIGEINWL